MSLKKVDNNPQNKGIYYKMGVNKVTGKPEKIFYIKYHRNGDSKQYCESVGREITHRMTVAKARAERIKKISGAKPPKSLKRAQEKAEKEKNKWTFDALWEARKNDDSRGIMKGIVQDDNRYNLYIKPTFGKKQVHELTQNIINNYISNLKGKTKNLSNGSKKNCLELLQRIINYAASQGIRPKENLVIKQLKLGKTI